jgi:Uma2 family endonuclease
MAAVLDKPKPKKKRWTYEDYYRLDDERRYELYRGELVPMQPPSPGYSHQRESRKLLVLLDQFVEKQKLGEVLGAPLDVIFDDENTAQPDILFVAKANAGIIQERGIFGAPDLVVEILSPGSVRRDRYEKQALYAEFGVKEYWIVDRANKSLEVLTLDGGQYRIHATAGETGHVTSKVLRGLKVKLSDLG